MGYMLEGWVSIPCRGKTFLYSVHIVSRSHPVSYAMDTRALFAVG
jgi:hypothetical protein